MSDKKRFFYWDTSAILSLIFKEDSSDIVKSLVKKNHALPAYTCFFSWVEIESALVRRIAEGSLSQDVSDIRLLINTLENYFVTLWPDEAVAQKSKSTVTEYLLRPGDALQLASCLELKSEIGPVSFVCLDKKLNKAALASGLNLLLNF